MGLFSSKPKQPKMVTCPCGTSLSDDLEAKQAHWDSHLVEVVANSGQPAFAFDCPQCGMSDQAWGAEDQGERTKRERAQAAMSLHMMQRHGIGL